MNKIKIVNDNIDLIETDELIEVTLSDKYELFDIRKMNIKVLGTTELIIEYENKLETKIDIEYNICENIKFKVIEVKQENKVKIQYKYNILKNSEVEVVKFYDVNNIKELDIINLNGENAKINYNFKTIAKDTQKYDIMVYHNSSNTSSNIINNSVNTDLGTTIFNITSVVYNGITGCILNQTSKIINLNDSNSIINPNLLIEENDVIANHSAYIGKFDSETIFYLMTRGISKEEVIKLLIKGFLYDKYNEQINKIIDKYWR